MMFQVEPAKASETVKLHLQASRLSAEGSEHEWLVKMRDGISDQLINNFCSMLPGNAECTVKGHPSGGGIPLVVMKGTEEELKEQLRRHPGSSEYVEPDIPMDAIPEVRSEEEEDDEANYVLNATGNEVQNSGNGSLQKNLSTPASWGLDRINNR